MGASVLMAEPASSGAFPGTNAKIAFQSNRDGNDEIYVMDADGSNQTNLTNSNDLYEGSPSWSPDGTKIVFRSAGRGYFGGAGQNGDIFVMDANGSNQTNLTNGVGSYHSPSWSPDGSKIVFSKSSEIWVMGSDGSNQIQISPNGGTAGSPSWSPDGSKILFSIVARRGFGVGNRGFRDGRRRLQPDTNLQPTQITTLPLPGPRTARKSFSLRRAMIQEGTSISS